MHNFQKASNAEDELAKLCERNEELAKVILYLLIN